MPLNTLSRDFNIVVSLTSFPDRLKHLNITIKSLMNQTLPADKIVLYLGEDTSEKCIPKKLLKLKKYGLEIKFEKDNLKPHKKYLYASKEYPSSFLITVDDDLIYDKDLIEDLWNTHLAYPDCVCARRVHLMKKDSSGILPYNKWENECSTITEPSFALFSTNGAGSLFPPGLFDLEFTDIEKIKQLCLNADDVWIKFHLLRKNKAIVWTGKNAFMPKEIFYPKKNKKALMNENVTQNMNDTYINNLQEYMGINLSDYC